MSELTTVARPYAKAAFDFAVENAAIDKWADMLVFAAEVAKDETIVSLLNGTTGTVEMTDIFIAVCGEQLDEHGQNLIKVMAENGRLSVLPAVVELYAELQAQYVNETVADVVSATELTEAQQASITAGLERRLDRKIKLNCSVDSALIAGVIIQAGDLVIDGSVRGKLDRLAHSLQS